MIYEQVLRQGGDAMLREASAFFEGEGRLLGALYRLARRLEAEGIPNALLGGLALAEHGYPRLTEDIDLPLTFGKDLDPSVRMAYRELWETVREGIR